LTNNDVTPVSY